MRTIELSSTTKADDYKALAIEAASILNEGASEDQDFQVADDCSIIEHDLTEANDPVYWSIDSVYWNEDGTASRLELDC